MPPRKPEKAEETQATRSEEGGRNRESDGWCWWAETSVNLFSPTLPTFPTPPHHALSPSAPNFAPSVIPHQHRSCSGRPPIFPSSLCFVSAPCARRLKLPQSILLWHIWRGTRGAGSYISPYRRVSPHRVSRGRYHIGLHRSIEWFDAWWWWPPGLGRSLWCVAHW